MFKILIADDEPNIRFVVKELLSEYASSVDEAEDGEIAIQKIRENEYDLLICDVRMPKKDGMQVLKEALKINPQIIVLMVTAFGTQQMAIHAIKEGAYDYFKKPFDNEELRIVVKRALEKSKLVKTINQLSVERDGVSKFDQIIGSDKQMQEVFQLIKKVINNDVTVLISGESGTGKELVAEAIHYHSYRKDGPFVKVNCVAIPETLLESEMFGYEKGAFTGAYQQKPGKFELAQGGTLFLDEIGDMPLSLQAKLLRILQEREFERVGGSKTIKADFRLITATNKNLMAAVEKKEFREDLFFRINVLPIYLPPLRNRISDIPILVEHFIKLYNAKLGKNIIGLTKEVLEIFLNYPWYGNIRELENVIQRAMILANSNQIDIDSIPKNVRENMTLNLQQKESSDYIVNFDFSKPLTYQLQEIMDKIEANMIREALKKMNYKRQETADLLGMSRKSLHNKMLKYNLFE